MRAQWIGLATLATLAWLSACTEEPLPGPAPAGTIEKSSLAGEWYVQSTVLNGTPGDPAFPGLQAPMRVVRWQVQEDFLVGYSAFEVLETGDDPAVGSSLQVQGVLGELALGVTCHDAASNAPLPCIANPAEGIELGYAGREGVVCRDGQGGVTACFTTLTTPVYVFAIEEHVDSIVLDGVAQEDHTRPWHARSFIRVDWSRNLATAADNFQFWPKWLLDSPLISTSVVETGMPGEDATTREVDAHGGLVALSFVSRNLLEPYSYAWGEFPYIWNVPGCMGYDGVELSCGGGMARIRTTLRRADGRPDFEVEDTDEVSLRRFPRYNAEIRNSDPYRGELLEGRAIRPFRFNVWQEVYQKAANGSYARDAEGRRLPLPEAERSAREVRYWLAGPWPDDLTDEVEVSIAAWDTLLREAVAWKRGVPLGEQASIIKLAYNGRGKAISLNGFEQPCAERQAQGRAQAGKLADGSAACVLLDFDPISDSALSGLPYEMLELSDPIAKIGDLRHHVVAWHSTHDWAGLYGYGPSAFDPRTGELIQASAHLYGANIHVGVSEVVDRINAFNGFHEAAGIDPKEHLDGPSIPSSTDAGGLSSAAGLLPLAQAERAFLGDVGAGNLARLSLEGSLGLPVADPGQAAFDAALIKHPELAASLHAIAPHDSHAPSTQALLRGLPEPGKAPTDRSGFPLCFAEPSQDAGDLLHFAEEFSDSPIEYGDARWEAIRARYVHWTLLHELGHNFGMMHNFAGSHDALNYPAEYWELRKESLAPLSASSTASDFLAVMQTTPAQQQGRMADFADASVMDYTAHRLRNFSLGRYDRANVLASYGGAVEVFDWSAGELDESVRRLLKDAALRSSPAEPSVTQRLHYSQLPFALSPTQSLSDGLGRMQARRLVHWADVRERLDAPDAPLLVPYEACNDIWRWQAPYCMPWDRGADDLETARAVVRSSQLNYVFEHTRRGREYFHSWHPQYPLWQRQRYLQSLFGHGLTAALDGSIEDPALRASFAAGTAVGFDFFTTMATLPNPGSYVRDTTYDYYYAVSDKPGFGEVDIEPGYGQPENAEIVDSESSGEYFAVNRMGHALTRWIAFRALANRMPIQSFDGETHRKMFVSYDLLFPEAVDALLGDYWLGDFSSYAPSLATNGKVTALDFKLGARPTRPAGLFPLYTPINFEMRKSILLAAYAFLREGGSLRFAETHGHIFRVGTAEEVLAGPGYHTLSFTVPSTGLTYGALERDDAPGFGVGPRHVANGMYYADVLATLPPGDPYESAYLYQIQAVATELDYMRALYAEFGNVGVGY